MDSGEDDLLGDPENNGKSLFSKNKIRQTYVLKVKPKTNILDNKYVYSISFKSDQKIKMLHTLLPNF